MELVLVRHALPERLETDGGIADPPLAPAGRDQADRMAASVAGRPVDALYTSPSRRARETVAPLADRFALEPIVVPELSEFDDGSAAYVPVEELARDDPRLLAIVEGRWASYGTDPAAFRRRVADALEAIIAAHPDQRVAVVTHGVVINAWLATLVAPERFPIRWFAAGYASVSRFLAARSGERFIVSLNENPASVPAVKPERPPSIISEVS
jgi:probable phosphoglycerate mutase